MNLIYFIKNIYILGQKKINGLALEIILWSDIKKFKSFPTDHFKTNINKDKGSQIIFYANGIIAMKCVYNENKQYIGFRNTWYNTVVPVDGRGSVWRKERYDDNGKLTCCIEYYEGGGIKGYGGKYDNPKPISLKKCKKMLEIMD